MIGLRSGRCFCGQPSSGMSRSCVFHHDRVDFTRAMHAGGQLELNVTRLTRTGDQRHIRWQSPFVVFIPQFAEEIEQVGYDLRWRQNRRVQRWY